MIVSQYLRPQIHCCSILATENSCHFEFWVISDVFVLCERISFFGTHRHTRGTIWASACAWASPYRGAPAEKPTWRKGHGMGQSQFAPTGHGDGDVRQKPHGKNISNMIYHMMIRICGFAPFSGLGVGNESQKDDVLRSTPCHIIHWAHPERKGSKFESKGEMGLVHSSDGINWHGNWNSSGSIGNALALSSKWFLGCGCFGYLNTEPHRVFGALGLTHCPFYIAMFSSLEFQLP